MFDNQINKYKELIKNSQSRNNSELYWLELKTHFVDEKSMVEIIGQNISGISNSCAYYKKEQGYIICGIEDETLKEIGVKFDPFNLKIGNQDAELRLRSCLVGVDFEFIPFKMNDLNFLLIEITRSQGQISSFSKVQYFRLGKNIKKLSDCSNEIQLKMVYSIKNSEYWNRIILHNLTQSQIISNLTYESYYLRQGKATPTNFENVISDFIDEGFIVKQNNFFSITFLGCLLFSRNLYNNDDLKENRVRVVTYKKNSKIKGYVKDIYGQKGYASGFDDILNYIISQIPEDQVVSGKTRNHQHKFSIVSIREFLANTLIHQDFLETTNPTIEIYPNRIEFINSGTCLVDIERIMDAVPRTRNHKLADIMRRLKICERQGSGIDRAVKDIEQFFLPAPFFENKPNGFISTLYAQKPFDSYTEKEKIKACYLHVCL